MLVAMAFAKTWLMCLASFGYFVVVALLARRLHLPKLERRLPAAVVFWTCLAAWFVLMSVILTLVDKPAFNVSAETKDWMFMFSAFLRVPLTIPLLACAVWGLVHALRGESTQLSELVLLALFAFALGCATSNIHDVVWCGVHTHGFSQHHKAGYDLDLFVGFAKWFGIPQEVSQDYSTLGPYAMVLVAGELLVAWASYGRLRDCCGWKPVAPASAK